MLLKAPSKRGFLMTVRVVAVTMTVLHEGPQCGFSQSVSAENDLVGSLRMYSVLYWHYRSGSTELHLDDALFFSL